MHTLEDYKALLAAVRTQTGLDMMVPDDSGLVSVRPPMSPTSSRHSRRSSNSATFGATAYAATSRAPRTTPTQPCITAEERTKP